MRLDEMAASATQQLREAIDDALEVDVALGATTETNAGSKSRPAWLVPALVAALLVAALITTFAVNDSTPKPPEPASSDSPQPTPTASPEPSPTETPAAKLEEPLYFVDVRTGKETRLPQPITAITFAQHFDVSPDGTKLAFSDNRKIYVGNVDGSNLRSIARATTAAAPQWSADGRTLVYAMEDTIVSTTVATGNVNTILVNNTQVYRPNLSPDGKTVLFTADAGEAFGLWTVPAAGGDPTLILERAAFGVYSPEGSRIAFRRTSTDGRDTIEMSNSAVWIANADGSAVEALANRGGWMSQIDVEALWPEWSPDGTQIAYEPLYDREVSTVDVATEDVAHVTASNMNPTWVDNHTLIIGKDSFEPFP